VKVRVTETVEIDGYCELDPEVISVPTFVEV
jgi:hypothetical protein